jgi:hypothetical protein
MLPFCYGFVTAPTLILSPFYRDVTSVTAQKGERGYMAIELGRRAAESSPSPPLEERAGERRPRARDTLIHWP